MHDGHLAGLLLGSSPEQMDFVFLTGKEQAGGSQRIMGERQEENKYSFPQIGVVPAHSRHWLDQLKAARRRPYAQVSMICPFVEFMLLSHFTYARSPSW